MYCKFDAWFPVMIAMPIFPSLPAGRKQPKYKAPQIQRLITPQRLQRKRHNVAIKRNRATKNKEEAAEYAKLLAQRQKEKRDAVLKRKRSASLRESARQSQSK